jgi:hypothetical protein
MTKYYIKTGVTSVGFDISLTRDGWYTDTDTIKYKSCKSEKELENLVKDFTKNKDVYIKAYEDREKSKRIIEL